MRRREFLKTAIGASAACGAASLVPRSVFGAHAPSNRINVGIIGLGNQSQVDLPAFLEQDDVQVVAVCDVNTASHGYLTPKQFLGRKPGQDAVNAYYAKKTNAGRYKGCDAYNDFREVLGRADVDAVAIIVPDHWHGIMTVMAAAGGQGHLLRETALADHPARAGDGQGGAAAQADIADRQHVALQRRRPKRLRVGPQRAHRASPKRIVTEVAENNVQSPGPGWKPMPVPEGFDYETWLGPAPRAPYHKDRCFYRFRFILDYSGGQTTNFGCHSN